MTRSLKKTSIRASVLEKAYQEQLDSIGKTLLKYGLITKRALSRDGVSFALEFTLNGRYLAMIAAGSLPIDILPAGKNAEMPKRLRGRNTDKKHVTKIAKTTKIAKSNVKPVSVP